MSSVYSKEGLPAIKQSLSLRPTYKMQARDCSFAAVRRLTSTHPPPPPPTPTLLFASFSLLPPVFPLFFHSRCDITGRLRRMEKYFAVEIDAAVCPRPRRSLALTWQAHLRSQMHSRTAVRLLALGQRAMQAHVRFLFVFSGQSFFDSVFP